MKASLLTEVGQVVYSDVPKPGIEQPDQVLIQIKAVGVCGSDVHFWEWGKIGDFVVNFPLIMGHEAAGVVVEVGSEVTDLKPGDRVALEPGLPCRRCKLCRMGMYNLCQNMRFLSAPPYDGCFCEYVVWPQDYCFKLPDNMTCEEGAMMEPLNVGLYGATRGPVQAGDTVLVTGGGPIGLMALQSAKALGAGKLVVTDPVEARRQFALQLGATVALDPASADFEARLRAEVGELGADVTLECSGAVPALQQACYFTRPGGALVSIGVFAQNEFELPIWHIQSREIDFKGIFRYRNLYPAAIALTASGQIDVKSMITARYPLEQLQEALGFSSREKGSAIKTVITVGE